MRMGWLGSQDPIYGIRRENLVERLTAANWTTKALVRQGDDRLLYVWISRDGPAEDPLQRTGMFHVNATTLPDGAARKFEVEFETLPEALAYANGEDGGRLARETRPAAVEEWPQDQSAEVTIVVGAKRNGPPDERRWPHSGRRMPDS